VQKSHSSQLSFGRLEISFASYLPGHPILLIVMRIWRFVAITVALGVGAIPLVAPPSAVASQVVSFTGESPGTIVIRTNQRRLYFVLSDGRAVVYPVGVGRAGKQWSGSAYIASKRIAPAWSPPAEIKRDRPGIPDVIPGGTPRNPMGAAALVLSHGEYAIHGTNNPGSIGGFVSYGCIRMHNRDIMDLYNRVQVGTPVVVK
jgi:lipoprotein-anchoring transpeptidase ErfK/SrfK